MGNPDILFASARIYQGKIDKINIARSSDLAASMALEKLLIELCPEDILEIILDGNLHLGLKKHEGLNAKTIIRGDEKRNPIKLASIVAKVTRDRYLKTLDNKYPQYSLGRNKGYGTRAHFVAIKEHGLSDIHRLTYLKR